MKQKQIEKMEYWLNRCQSALDEIEFYFPTLASKINIHEDVKNPQQLAMELENLVLHYKQSIGE